MAMVLGGCLPQKAPAQSVPYVNGSVLVVLAGPLSLSSAATTCSTSSSGCVVRSLTGQSTCSVQVSGTFVGTLVIESAVDFIANNATPNWATPPGWATTSFTGAGSAQGSCANASAIRVRMSAYTSGIAIVTIIGSPGVLGNAANSVTANSNIHDANGVNLIAGSPAPQAGATPSANGLFTNSVPHCFYSTTAATPSAGTVVPLQCNSAGQLTTTVASGSLTATQGAGANLHQDCDNCGLPFPGNADAQATGANQSTGIDWFNGSTYDRALGIGAPGQTGIAAPTKGMQATVSLGACIYSTTAVTATSGNLYPLQCNSSGQLITNASGGGGGINPTSEVIYPTSGYFTATTCTAVIASAHTLYFIDDFATVSEGAQLSLYNDASCATTPMLTISPGNGATYQWNAGKYFSSVIYGKWSVAPTVGVRVTVI